MAELSGGLGWLIVVNLLLWTGLFLYLLRLQRTLRAAERDAAESHGHDTSGQ